LTTRSQRHKNTELEFIMHPNARPRNLALQQNAGALSQFHAPKKKGLASP
jgi:hypothetical protein